MSKTTPEMPTLHWRFILEAAVAGIIVVLVTGKGWLGLVVPVVVITAGALWENRMVFRAKAKEAARPSVVIVAARLLREPPRSPEPDVEAALQRGKCPDCGGGPLIEGPSGGAATNYLCDNCLSEFNLGFFGETVFLINRNGKASPERARTVFGREPRPQDDPLSWKAQE